MRAPDWGALEIDTGHDQSDFLFCGECFAPLSLRELPSPQFAGVTFAAIELSPHGTRR